MVGGGGGGPTSSPDADPSSGTIDDADLDDLEGGGVGSDGGEGEEGDNDEGDGSETNDGSEWSWAFANGPRDDLPDGDEYDSGSEGRAYEYADEQSINSPTSSPKSLSSSSPDIDAMSMKELKALIKSAGLRSADCFEKP